MSLLESRKPMHDNVPVSHSSYAKRHPFIDIDNVIEWGKPWIYQYFPKPEPIKTIGLESGPMGSWDSRCSLEFGQVLYDEGRFRYWGYCMPDPESHADLNEGICLAAYAESEDGIHWVKPDLGLAAQKRWPGNNLLAMPGIICGVVRPLPGAGCKFLAMVIATGIPSSYERTEIYGPEVFEFNGPGTYLMASDDGLRWRQFTKNPILTHGDIGSLHVDHARQRYLMYHKAATLHGLTSRRSAIALESKDAIHWEGYHGYRQWHESMTCDDYDDLLAAQRGCYIAETYSQSIHQVDKLYLSLQTILMLEMPLQTKVFQNPYGPSVLRMAFSHDGLIWRYPKGRPAFVEPEPPGSQNSGYMTTINGFIEKDDEMFIYITAHRYTHCWGLLPNFLSDPNLPIEARHAYSIPYLLRIKRDRFGALGSNHPTAFDVELGPRQGKGLALNIITRGAGSVRAALAEASSAWHMELRKSDNLPGFSFDDCLPMTGDQVKAPVRFKNQSIAAIPENLPLILRVKVDAGEVYGYEWVDA